MRGPGRGGGARRLELVIEGDRRLAEDVILEVRALAKRYGLEVPTARVRAERSQPRRRVTTRGR